MKTKRFYALFCWIIFLTIYSCKEYKLPLLNLDFENVDSHTKKASGWRYTDNGYTVSIDKTVVNHGKYSLKIESPSNQNENNDRCWVHIMFDSIPGNQKIRFSGYIKNEGTNCDSMGLSIFCKSPVQDSYKILKSNNFRGTHDWQEYSVEITSPDSTEYILLGIEGNGSGTIWADNLKLYLNDKQIIYLPVSNTFKANKDEIIWLKNHVVPLKTVHAENGFNDLAPLKESLKNARIIALGENSHGTSEIFEMKHRLLEFLSIEMGFNVFLIESAMFDSDPISDYVQNGNGNPKELMTTLTPAWQTQEVLDMIIWMRKYNEKSKRKIQFTGIDMTSYYGSLKNLVDFGNNHDLKLKKLSDSLQIMLSNISFSSIGSENKKLLLSKIRKCNQVLSYLQESQINASINKNELRVIIQNVIIIRQFLEYYSCGQLGRDKNMAENVSWILDSDPDAKVVLWAHNEHVSKKEDAMGGFLAKKYGAKYYSIGFITNKGKYTAGIGNVLSTKNEFLKAEPGSFEYNFSKTGLPYFFFDLKAINGNEPNSKWLDKRLNQRTLGASASENQFFPTILKEKFDAVIFINSTTPAKTFLPTNN